MIWLLAQSQQFDPDQLKSIVVSCLIMGAVLLAALAAWVVWKKRSVEGPSPAEGFSLSQLRELAEQGEISQDEYFAMRSKIIARFKRGDDCKDFPPEKPGKGRLNGHPMAVTPLTPDGVDKVDQTGESIPFADAAEQGTVPEPAGAAPSPSAVPSPAASVSTLTGSEAPPSAVSAPAVSVPAMRETAAPVSPAPVSSAILEPAQSLAAADFAAAAPPPTPAVEAPAPAAPAPTTAVETPTPALAAAAADSPAPVASDAPATPSGGTPPSGA